MRTVTRSLMSGAAGALTLTLVHELARRRLEAAPRMDVVALRGLRRMLPQDRLAHMGARDLHRLALAGDLVSNSLYYAAIAAPSPGATWMRAMVLGTAAGVGALLVPGPAGLGPPPHSDDRANQAMTVGWYLAGAVAAAVVATLTARSERNPVSPARDAGTDTRCW